MATKKKAVKKLYIEYNGEQHGVEKMSLETVVAFGKSLGLKKIDVFQGGKKINPKDLKDNAPVKIVPADWGA